jgi:hypothetical protein
VRPSAYGYIAGVDVALIPGAAVFAQPLVSQAPPEFQLGFGIGEGAVGIGQGVAGASAGGGGGGALCTSGIGCAVGAPVIVVGGAAVVVGVTNFGLGVYNIASASDRMRGETLSQEPSASRSGGTRSEPSELKWGNSKSRPTYGHTFDEHGAKKTPAQLTDRARAQGVQNGQWTNDQAAADFVADVAKRGPGVHEVPLPQGVGGRSFLPNGAEVVSDSARIVVNPNGGVKTSFPYSSQHPN